MNRKADRPASTSADPREEGLRLLARLIAHCYVGKSLDTNGQKHAEPDEKQRDEQA